MVDRVVGLGGGEDACERGRLRDRQPLRRDPEVGLRGRFDPVGAVSEVHRVEVLREDRVLRERAFHLEGEEHLTDLLLDRARRDHVVGDPVLALDVVTRVHTLHELLRDRRAPLDRFARDQVAPCRADRALEVHAAVVVEASVLHGDHRVPEMLGDLPHRDDRPVDGAVERGQQLAVAVVHERGLDRRERLRQIDPHVGEGQHAEPQERERDGRQRERPPVPAEESLGGLLLGLLASVLGLPRVLGLHGHRGGGSPPGARSRRRRSGPRRLLLGVPGTVVLRGSSGCRGHDGRNSTRGSGNGNRPGTGRRSAGGGAAASRERFAQMVPGAGPADLDDVARRSRMGRRQPEARLDRPDPPAVAAERGPVDVGEQD